MKRIGHLSRRRRVAPPQVKDQAWRNNEIDPFILAKLEAMGLTPSVKADRRTLIRRLSYDLTGLPPSIQEVHQFVNDIHANAYLYCLKSRSLVYPQWCQQVTSLVMMKTSQLSSTVFSLHKTRQPTWMFPIASLMQQYR